MDDSDALPLGMLIAYIIASFLFGCESRTWQGSATAKVIKVEKHDVVGSDYKTTVVFEDGQVESFWREVGEPGDILFFSDVQMRKSDSAIVAIPYSAIIKNVTKGRELYGQ